MSTDKQALRTALVCGAGGFVGAHLVRRLVENGYWVRGADLKPPEYAPTAADEFEIADLRAASACRALLRTPLGGVVNEVYQLAADMGGVGFLQAAECDIMHNNCLINLNMLHAAATAGVERYLLTSSACVYRDMTATDIELTEADAYPALPHNEYGWEKLYAERTAMAYGRQYGMAIRLARLQNCYGPEGTWVGGREKVPAAICRKVAECGDEGCIEVWGDGTAMRAFTYVDDITRGITTLMASDLENGVNIGRREYVSVNQLVRIITEISGKAISVRHVDGPVGVLARNFKAERIAAIGWSSSTPLREGLLRTYGWIDAQVKLAATAGQGG